MVEKEDGPASMRRPAVVLTLHPLPATVSVPMPVRLADGMLRSMLASLVVLGAVRSAMSARGEMPRTVLQILKLMEDLGAVECSDVLGLDGRQAPNGPAQMHEVGLDRMRERMHPDLFRQLIPLPGVTRAACGDDIAPVVGAATGERNQVIPRQCFTRAQLDRGTTAVLTAIAIAGEEKCVGDLTTETAGYVNEPRQSDDRRARHSEPLRANDASLIRFHNLGLAVDDEPECAFDRHHRQRLERGVQCQTTQHHASLLLSPN